MPYKAQKLRKPNCWVPTYPSKPFKIGDGRTFRYVKNHAKGIYGYMDVNTGDVFTLKEFDRILEVSQRIVEEKRQSAVRLESKRIKQKRAMAKKAHKRIVEEKASKRIEGAAIAEQIKAAIARINAR